LEKKRGKAVFLFGEMVYQPALMSRTRTPERLARIQRVLAARRNDLTLVLANIHDPHNVSAIYRSCDAFGVHRVNLYYTHTSFPALGAKSSASARKWVETVRCSNAAEMIGGFREKGFQVASTGFNEGARSVTEWDFTKPTAIILGNEHDGVDQELDDLVPDQLYIPMQGMVQSLNVSVAAAVILFEAWRQRAAAGMDEPSLSPEELEELEALWREK
jgi:tRNA (guanosine-2'-O-)-methyltransferase